jgi:predicted HTH domain antitoxin
MTHIDVEIPEKIFSVLHCSPRELYKETQLAAAVHWYQQGRISQDWSANIAGMDRTDFLLALAGHTVCRRHSHVHFGMAAGCR